MDVGEAAEKVRVPNVERAADPASGASASGWARGSGSMRSDVSSASKKPGPRSGPRLVVRDWGGLAARHLPRGGHRSPAISRAIGRDRGHV